MTYDKKYLKQLKLLSKPKGITRLALKISLKKVGVKTSSIHYYFPTKGDLGQAVVRMHLDSFCNELEKWMHNKQLSNKKKLERFIDGIVTNTYAMDRKMCLGGMLASDVLTLPEIIQQEVRIFFTRLEDWLKQLFIDAIHKKEFNIEKKNIKNETLFFFSLLEGALLLARLFQDEGHLTVARKCIIDRYCKE